MAAFVEADRVQMRRWIGFASIYTTQDPRLESAITALQARADGGTQPTNDAQQEVYAILYGAPAGTTVTGATLPQRDGLAQIWAQIGNLSIQQGAGSVGKGAVTIDSAREFARLRIYGKLLVAQLCTMLDTYPRRDVFSPLPVGTGGHARRDPYGGMDGG